MKSSYFLFILALPGFTSRVSSSRINPSTVWSSDHVREKTPNATEINSSANNVSTTAASGFKSFVYFVNWAVYDRSYHAQQLPASQITHVLYAFWNIAASGALNITDSYADLERHYPTDTVESGNNLYGSLKQLYILKKKNRHLKTLMSVGGWTYSTNYPAAASTTETRAKFASDVVKYVRDLGFDGVDLDWEYPADDTQAANFVLLLAQVRKQLDDYAATYAPGYHFLITVACPAGASHYQKMHLAEMNKYIDTWNLMAYDYSGAWDTHVGHDANLYPSTTNALSTPYNTHQAIKDYVSAGVAASKILMGIPLYGRSFLQTAGLGQTFNGVGTGSWEKGIYDYKALPPSGHKEYSDDETVTSYSYDASSQTLTSYDNADVVKKKVKYIQSQGLGGAMFWEASGDKLSGESLIGTTATALGALEDAQNCLTYSGSQYANVAAGMPGE